MKSITKIAHPDTFVNLTFGSAFYKQLRREHEALNRIRREKLMKRIMKLDGQINSLRIELRGLVHPDGWKLTSYKSQMRWDELNALLEKRRRAIIVLVELLEGEV